MGLLRQAVAIREMKNSFRGSGMIPLLSSIFIPFSVGIKKRKQKTENLKHIESDFSTLRVPTKSYSTITVSVIIISNNYPFFCILLCSP